MTGLPFDPNRIRPPAKPRKAASDGLLTVSQITTLVKRAIADILPASVQVVGEISNFKRHSSGHLYFTLKDASSELACVMWRSAAASMRFKPTDGLEIMATGRVEVFERAGRYQLYVRKMEPRGVGSLELAFRQLKEKLEKERLFSPEHKQVLPAYPERIVVVTSPTGAAIADILRTIARRYPVVDVFVYPVRVQGPGAAGEIAQAIGAVNRDASSLGGVDLMIVGRGGGSLEDLWAFNEEEVARAIHASVIPIISAVGHEVDISIADLTADVRAATPTAAAELAVPVLDELLAQLDAYARRIDRGLVGEVRALRAEFAATAGRPIFDEPAQLVYKREEQVDELVRRMSEACWRRMRTVRDRLDRAQQTIQRIAPHRVMLRRAMTLARVEQRMSTVMDRAISESGRRLANVSRELAGYAPHLVVRRYEERVALLMRELATATAHRFAHIRQRLDRNEDLLSAVSYKRVLTRGYSITRVKKEKAIIKSPKEVTDGVRVVTETAEGTFESEVVNQRQLELFE